MGRLSTASGRGSAPASPANGAIAAGRPHVCGDLPIAAPKLFESRPDWRRAGDLAGNFLEAVLRRESGRGCDRPRTATNVSLSGAARAANVSIDAGARGCRVGAGQKRLELAGRRPFCVNVETTVTNGGQPRHLAYKS
jgi:hypothetical protein